MPYQIKKQYLVWESTGYRSRGASACVTIGAMVA